MELNGNGKVHLNGNGNGNGHGLSNGAVEKRKTSGLTVTSEDTRPGGLRVRLIGKDVDRVAEVKASLATITEPKIETLDAVAGSFVSSQTYREPADVVMVMLNTEDESALTHLEHYGRTEPRPALFALLQEQSPTLMKLALRAGADELLFMPLNGGDTTRALLKVSESRRRIEKRSGGVVCSIASLAGGSGVTTIAMNLALALRYELNRRVALVDLDFQAAMLNVAMNVDSEHSILAVSSQDRALDSIRLEAAMAKHPSGVYVLGAPKHVEDSELVPEGAVESVLSVLRQMFDFVVVDCGDSVNEHVVAAWERSDHLFYALEQSIGSARCAWRFLELFKRLRIAGIQPQFVLSKYQPAYPITVEQVSQTLARPMFCKIPRDEKAMERVELMGKDLWQVAPSAAITKSFQDLAKRMAEQPKEIDREPNGSVVSRLVSAIVSRARGANE